MFVSNVLVQLVCVSESLMTTGTWEGSVSTMQANVSVPGSQLDELLGTVRTGESLSCMDESMFVQVDQPLEWFGAVRARVGHAVHEVSEPFFHIL